MPALKLSIREYKGVFGSPPQRAVARHATSVACHVGQTPTPQLAEGLAATARSGSSLMPQLANCVAHDLSAALVARPQQLWRRACAAGDKHACDAAASASSWRQQQAAAWTSSPSPRRRRSPAAGTPRCRTGCRPCICPNAGTSIGSQKQGRRLLANVT